VTDSPLEESNFGYLKGPALFAAVVMGLSAVRSIIDLWFPFSLLLFFLIVGTLGIPAVVPATFSAFFVVLHRRLAGRASAKSLKKAAALASIAAGLGTCLAALSFFTPALHNLVRSAIWLVAGVVPELLLMFFFASLARTLDLRGRFIRKVAATLVIAFLIRAIYETYRLAKIVELWVQQAHMGPGWRSPRAFLHYLLGPLDLLLVPAALILFFGRVWKGSVPGRNPVS
jgi:hypothetical protein